MRILLTLLLCCSLCLVTGCYAARKGAQEQAALSAASNSVASAILSTGKVDNVAKLLKQMKGQNDIAGLIGEFNAIGPPVFPGLIKLLKEGSKTERANVMYVLGCMRAYPPEAVPVIEDMLDEQGVDRVRVALDLQKISPYSEKVYNVLAEEMRRAESSTRMIIARTLSLNPNADKILPILLSAMTDPDADVRMAVMQTLGDIGMRNKAAGAAMVPSLIKALDDPSREVCVQVARALGLIGEPARSAVPSLEKIKTDDKRTKVREAAAKALILINIESSRKPGNAKPSKKTLKSLL